MPYIHPKGSPSSDIWVVIDKPLAKDTEKGYLYSSGLGYVFDNMMQDAGIKDYYVCAYRPDTDHPQGYVNIEARIEQYMPKVIIPLDAVGQKLCPELRQTRQGKNYNAEEDSEIFKYAGSPLKSPWIKHPHWVYPTLPPELIVRQYKLRDQVVLDLAKAADELRYYKEHGIIQPPTQRTLKFEFESFDEILHELDKLMEFETISNDIENIYFKKSMKSEYYGNHPGYPIILGLASSAHYGISIDVFRESDIETAELWRRLDRLFRNTIQLGQNFMSFDANYYEALGFRFREVVDTLLMHHLLWPELPHKLQHLTRQYTREPYYKDEGHGWSNKNRSRWKMYNCKDVCVTYEVWERMCEELQQRPHLK